jgi:hypothetical protein
MTLDAKTLEYIRQQVDKAPPLSPRQARIIEAAFEAEPEAGTEPTQVSPPTRGRRRSPDGGATPQQPAISASPRLPVMGARPKGSARVRRQVPLV